MNKQTEVQPKQENPILNIVFNILLPVIILNQATKRLGEDGPLFALLLALAFPIGYGIYDYLVRKKKNYISILGVVNVSFTGGFALLELNGIWFAVKEAFFPFMIGAAIFISNLYNRSLLKVLFWNESVFNIRLIDELITKKNKSGLLTNLFYKSTNWFAASFLLSSLLNFVLAARIFLPIDPAQTNLARKELLNEQIAQMTWQGYVVIALPMMVFMGLILWYVIHQLKQITELSFEELLVDHGKSS